MSWTDAIEDRWGSRNGTLRLVVRLGGLGFFCLLLVQSGAFAGPLWVAVGTGLAIVLSFVLLILRTWRPFDRIALVLTVALMICGIALNPRIDYLGTVFFVIGGIIVVGQPEVPARLAIGLTAALSLGLVARAVVANPEWTVLLSNLFGAVAVILFGANRRQRVLRQRDTARVTALEERNRIARDLHDVLAHSLGGLVVQLDAAGAELESGRTSEAASRIRASRQLAVDGLHEARAAVAQLRSDPDSGPDREPADLVGALERVIRGPVGLHLGADLEVVGQPRRVVPEIVDALLAIAREGLTNINKHAPGSAVSATLVFEPSSVRLEIVNGLPASGQPVGDLAASGGGAGLPGLRERLDPVGGRLESGVDGRRWVLAAECPTPAAVGGRR